MDEVVKGFDLPITISGLAALTTFSFKSEKALAYKTFITQEMLKKVILLLLQSMFVLLTLKISLTVTLKIYALSLKQSKSVKMEETLLIY